MTVKKIHRMVSASLRKTGIARGVLVLAAISGGRDSVVLLDVLCALREKIGFDLYAAHVNHGIRQTADRDETFVRSLCQTLNVPFLCEHVNVPLAKQLSGRSTEDAARRLRYEALRTLASDCHASCILTAHHADDQTETVVMGLLRGSYGMLCGMREVTRDARGTILRPMLQVSGDDIARYALQRELSFCRDETNEDLNYLRNRLRHEVIPHIRKSAGGNLDQSVQMLSSSLQRDADCLQQLAQTLYDAHVRQDGAEVFFQEGLCQCHEALILRVVQQALRKLNVSCAYRTQQAIAKLFQNQTGSRLDLGRGWQAQRLKSGILICTIIRTQDRHVPIEMGRTVTPWGVFRMTGPYTPCDFHVGPNCLWIAQDKIDSLYVRLPKPAERMQPMGFGAKKLFSDIMCDAGLDTFARSRRPVVCDRAGPIWIVGCRAEERLRLNAGQEAYLLEFEAILKE